MSENGKQIANQASHHGPDHRTKIIVPAGGQGRSMPIVIQLLDENSNGLDIDQGGLKWVASPS